MKKLNYVWIVGAILIVLVGNLCRYKVRDMPDYEICQCFTFGADNYEEANLTVIVNIKEYDIEEMLNTVREQYCERYGVPDVLKIKLFDSKKDWETYNCRAAKTYYKDKGLSEITG